MLYTNTPADTKRLKSFAKCLTGKVPSKAGMEFDALLAQYQRGANILTAPRGKRIVRSAFPVVATTLGRVIRPASCFGSSVSPPTPSW